MKFIKRIWNFLKKRKKRRHLKMLKLRKSISNYIKNRESPDSFTKRLVSLILNNAIVWVYLTYLLAFIGKEAIAENLSITVVKVIIATILSYLCKSLFEHILQFGPFNIKENNYISEEIVLEESSNTEITESESEEMTEIKEEVSEEDCAG